MVPGTWDSESQRGIHGPIASIGTERPASTREVVGSSPTRATKLFPSSTQGERAELLTRNEAGSIPAVGANRNQYVPVAQLDERENPSLEDAGSTPVGDTNDVVCTKVFFH